MKNQDLGEWISCCLKKKDFHRPASKFYSLGIRSSGIHKFASFTPDGNHIVSASEDSNICIWNYATQEKRSSKPKIILPCESFFSYNASITIPWCGIRSSTTSGPITSSDDGQQQMKSHNTLNDYFDQKRPDTSSPDCFSMGKGFLLELLPKVSPTWPEEKLSDSGRSLVSPTMCRSECKLLRSAVMDSPHLWGLVIATAGGSGRIKITVCLPVRDDFGSKWK